MSVQYEWDDRKAAQNVEKHGIPFDEAATVFSDPLSLTIDDLLHSLAEQRFVTIGESAYGRLLVVVHTERDDVIRIIGAREATAAKGEIMRKAEEQQASETNEMLAEYDFSKGVRGKYARRAAEGSNIVVLAPDVAEVFPTSEVVNEALRGLIVLARKTGKAG